MEKSAETAMVFYKSAPSAAAATLLNQKQCKIGFNFYFQAFYWIIYSQAHQES